MTYGTYQRICAHVSDSDITVIRKSQSRLAPDGRVTGKHHADFKEWRKAYYRKMLAYHHDWQQTCRDWRM
jgi:hypothetical protein